MAKERDNISVYIPRNAKNLFKVCRIYAKDVLKLNSFSNFLILCMKKFVNDLSKEDKNKFEEIARNLSKKEKPRAVDFVDNFMRSK